MKTSSCAVFTEGLASENRPRHFCPRALRGGALPCGAVFYLFSKRFFDLLFSAVALLFLWPLLLALAIWVRLDSDGPALYRQTRVGKNGREFEVLKFRTMSIAAEMESGPVWAVKNDTRITRAGHILRKLYLDELPQLINVVKGEMSLVGPRPERPFFYPLLEKEIPGFSRRCCVQPGLTGLAQVRQCHQASLGAVQRKFTYDIFYLRHRGFGFDLYIIWKTIDRVYLEFKEVLR
ncbi:TPA: UDP-phosphate N-acetylgalactosaminyl-1-phosphate transferase [Candidatus Sumerlaeota bacterium]|nr:UDP-phosphate N-acetylgalactosaminyl-1-phosphate transferase [Candidatus Sumerlaeota bacterium]